MTFRKFPIETPSPPASNERSVDGDTSDNAASCSWVISRNFRAKTSRAPKRSSALLTSTGVCLGGRRGGEAGIGRK